MLTDAFVNIVIALSGADVEADAHTNVVQWCGNGIIIHTALQKHGMFATAWFSSRSALI